MVLIFRATMTREDKTALTAKAVEIEQGEAAGSSKPMNNHMKVCGLIGCVCAVVLVTVSAVVLTSSKGGNGSDGQSNDDSVTTSANATSTNTLDCVPVVLEGN